MAYTGSIELISGIKTKNSGTFPLVDAADVRIDDNTRLSNFAAGKGSANGLASLDQNGKVPSSQLPSYVDDVLEYTNKSSFPQTGETGKIYVETSTNKSYRWSGSQYVVIASDLALGETSGTAYRGDRGKTAYDHASAKGSAFASDLYKLTTNAQGHVTAATAVTKQMLLDYGLANADDIASKAPIANPEFTGSISLGRNPSTTVGNDSVAFGSYCEASGDSSFAHGNETIASGDFAFAIGAHSEASGNNSFVFGRNNIIDNSNDIPLWQPSTVYNVGDVMKRENGGIGYCCIQRHQSSSNASSWYNVDSRYWEQQGYNYVEIVGNGVSLSNRSNARALDWNGNEYLNGDIYVNCNSDSTGGHKVISSNYIASASTVQAIINGYAG